MTKVPPWMQGLQSIHRKDLQSRYPDVDSSHFDDQGSKNENEDRFAKENHSFVGNNNLNDADYMNLLHQEFLKDHDYVKKRIYEDAIEEFLENNPLKDQLFKRYVPSVYDYVQGKVEEACIVDEDEDLLTRMTFDPEKTNQVIHKYLKRRGVSASTITDNLPPESRNSNKRKAGKASGAVRLKISGTKHAKSKPCKSPRYKCCLCCETTMPFLRDSKRWCSERCKKRYQRKIDG